MGGGLSRHELAAAVSEAGGWGRSRSTGRPRSSVSSPPAQGADRGAARGQPAAALRPARLVRGRGRGRRRSSPSGAGRGGGPRRLDAPVRLGRGGARGARGRRRRGDRPGRRGGRPRARTTPALELPERVRGALPAGYPAAARGRDRRARRRRRALEAGAGAAVAGTRFLLSEESRAHPGYGSACWRRRRRPHGALRRRLAGAAPRRRQRRDRSLARRGPAWPAPEPCCSTGSRQPALATCRQPSRPASAAPSARTAACSRRSGPPTTASRPWSTPARSTPARRSPASRTSGPRPSIVAALTP